MTVDIKRTYRVKVSPPDPRDFVFKQTQPSVKKEVDLRMWDSPVENQHDMGACTAHAVSSAYELQVKKLYPDKFAELSRLYVYYHTRYLEGSIDSDSGVLYTRNALQAVKKFGVCTESLWPYSSINLKKQPLPECYAEGVSRSISSYRALSTITDMLEVLSSDNPVVIGLDVYSGFSKINKDSPFMASPASSETLLGGHSMMIVGYNLANERFLVKNSFGQDWGDGGYAWMPFDYARKYVFERWLFEITPQNQPTILPKLQIQIMHI